MSRLRFPAFLVICLIAAFVSTYVYGLDPCTHLQKDCVLNGAMGNTTCCIDAGQNTYKDVEYVGQQMTVRPLPSFECGHKRTVGLIGPMRFCTTTVICDFCCGGTASTTACEPTT